MPSITMLRLLVPTLCLLSYVCGQTNISSQYDWPIDIDSSDLAILDRSGISVNCTNCYVRGNLALSAGSETNLPNSNFSSLRFNYSQDWAAGMMNFTAHFDLDYSITEPEPDIEGSNGLIPYWEDGITLHTGAILLGIGWTFNPKVYTSINTSKAVNFSYGFEFKIPDNSAFFVPLEGNSSAEVIGFNEAALTPLNYTSPDVNEDFNFSISFRPEFTIAVEALELFNIASASIFVDVPKLDVTVTQVYNTTQDCKPAAAGTPTDQIFNNLTFVEPTIGYDVGYEIDIIGFTAAEETFSVGVDQVLLGSCLIYSMEEHGLVKVPERQVHSESSGFKTVVLGQTMLIWAVVVLSAGLL